ncbi:hypothetical protein LMG27198_17560 [Methylocystis echinoides]|uniref:Uncharacterized protein n=1 Tax=Methylocystis echinoides TaxID=29468 RepID=A0A9W6GTP8_9HYPH|nr:hypothetical protein LMG27198_17560 [Methylocystis echinoides]
MGDARFLRRNKQVQMRLMVDRPGVLRRPGSGGHTGYDGVEPLAPKSVFHERCGLRNIDKPHGGAIEQRFIAFRQGGSATVRARANEANHAMSAPHERAQRRPAYCSGGADQAYPQG